MGVSVWVCTNYLASRIGSNGAQLWCKPACTAFPHKKAASMAQALVSRIVALNPQQRLVFSKRQKAHDPRACAGTSEGGAAAQGGGAQRCAAAGDCADYAAACVWGSACAAPGRAAAPGLTCLGDVCMILSLLRIWEVPRTAIAGLLTPWQLCSFLVLVCLHRSTMACVNLFP